MGLSKTDLFTEEQNHLAQMAKALAHPARIAILQEVLKSNHCINSSLVNELGLAQATISQHLKALKDAQILQGSVEGACMSYCINQKTWASLQHLFQAFFNKPVSVADCCETEKP